jgi:hypothetical protein
MIGEKPLLNLFFRNFFGVRPRTIDRRTGRVLLRNPARWPSPRDFGSIIPDLEKFVPNFEESSCILPNSPGKLF